MKIPAVTPQSVTTCVRKSFRGAVIALCLLLLAMPLHARQVSVSTSTADKAQRKPLRTKALNPQNERLAAAGTTVKQTSVKAADWTLVINAPLSQQQTFTFGMDAAATEAFDPGLDVETPVSPPFAFGALYSALFVDGLLDITLSTDIRASDGQEEWFLVTMAPTDNSMTLTWDTNTKAIPADALLTLTETDVDGHPVPDGTSIIMNETTELTVAAGAVRYFRIRYLTEPYFILPLTAGWNLISLPLQPDNPDPGEVFSELNAVSPATGKAAFSFTDGRGTISSDHVWAWDASTRSYVPAEDIQALHAYWVHAGEDIRVVVDGTVPEDTTVNLKRGWNVLGSHSDMTLPANPVIRGLAWFWSPEAQRYLITNQLDRGYGYWLNSAISTDIEIDPAE